jgi:hypothetical protein
VCRGQFQGPGHGCGEVLFLRVVAVNHGVLCRLAD